MTIAFYPVVSNAAEPELLSKTGDWAAYALDENGNKVCYMVSQPVDAKGNYKNRGDVYAMVTHHPSEGTRDVFSYYAGYTYQPGSESSVSVDSKKFALMTQDDTAWAVDDAKDAEMVAAMKSGAKMVVRGTSSRGTLTTDSFSLKGVSAAYKAISKACGVK